MKAGIVVSDDEKAVHVALNAIKILEQLSIEYVVYRRACEHLRVCAKYCDKEELSNVDFIMCIGGDGTILETVSVLKKVPPVLGINAGTVGFLTEIDERLIEWALEKIIEKDYFIDKRARAKVTVGNKASFLVLNEIVFTGERPFKVFKYRVLVDGHLVYEDRGDGIIVATPTGSTAYSLSAGGPVLDPEIKALVLCPLCSYNSWTRPLVVSASRKITLYSVKQPGLVVYDGIGSYSVRPREKISVELPDSYSVKFIRFTNNPFKKLEYRLKGGAL